MGRKIKAQHKKKEPNEQCVCFSCDEVRRLDVFKDRVENGPMRQCERCGADVESYYMV